MFKIGFWRLLATWLIYFAASEQNFVLSCCLLDIMLVMFTWESQPLFVFTCCTAMTTLEICWRVLVDPIYAVKGATYLLS